jgi:RHS repeat-associated protein
MHIFAGNKLVASVFADGKMQFYHTNHLGSTSVITDQNGDKKEKMEYYPFGTYRAVGNINGTYDFDPAFPDVFYTFTGQEDDDDLGLYNYKARLYDPLLGRFICPDSTVPYPDNPQSLNRYSYCRNNPLAYTDPSGHEDGGDDKGGNGGGSGIWSDLGSLLGGIWDSLIGSYFTAPDSPSFAPGGYNITLSSFGDGMLPSPDNTALEEARGLVEKFFKGEGISSFLDKIFGKAMSGINTTDEGKLKALKDAAKMADTLIKYGDARAPKQGEPNSIYEQLDDSGNVRSRTFYDENGHPFAHQDFDHHHGRIHGPHEQQREFDAQGRPITKERTIPLPPGYDNKRTKW